MSEAAQSGRAEWPKPSGQVARGLSSERSFRREERLGGTTEPINGQESIVGQLAAIELALPMEEAGLTPHPPVELAVIVITASVIVEPAVSPASAVVNFDDAIARGWAAFQARDPCNTAGLGLRNGNGGNSYQGCAGRDH